MFLSSSRKIQYRYKLALNFAVLCGVIFPSWGSPYETAAHYWSMSNISKKGLLEDSTGSAHSQVHNGVKIKKVFQIGYALQLDGIDDWVNTGGFNKDCVTNPASCYDGFTITFWLKSHKTGYIMSSGSFTNNKNGPGFRLTYSKKLERYSFVVETKRRRWLLYIHCPKSTWVHMTFMWQRTRGLTYYENGNLSIFNGSPLVIATNTNNPSPEINIARPYDLLQINNFSKLEITQFAIWMQLLTASNVWEVYARSVENDQEANICCYFKKGSKCFRNPCNTTACEIAKQTYRCICPQVKFKKCKDEPPNGIDCKDRSSRCGLYSQQTGYCQTEILQNLCPKSCALCVGPTACGGDTSVCTDKTQVHNNRVPNAQVITARDIVNNTNSSIRKMPRGPSCNLLKCLFYASCVMRDKGYAECECPGSCHLRYEPVCADNDKSYENKCAMKLDSCRRGKWIRVQKKGECGEPPYQNAVHYWPMNNFTKSTMLLDIRSHSKTQSHSDAKLSHADQLGPVIQLDGKNAWIYAKKLPNKCISNPTDCREGLTVAFWINYVKGKYILSCGQYTVGKNGPGFQIFYSKQKRHFVMQLATQSKNWIIEKDYLPRNTWFHVCLTWHKEHGLKFYKNGVLVVTNTKPISVNYSPLGRRSDSLTIGRPNSLGELHAYGQFSIGHLVLWTNELTQYEVQVAFESVLFKTTHSRLCCHSRKADPCVTNPCHNGGTCKQIDETFKCVCPDQNTGDICENSVKPLGECKDYRPDCLVLVATEPGKCQSNRRYMERQCPKACKLCSSDINKLPSTRPFISTLISKIPASVQPLWCGGTGGEACVCYNCHKSKGKCCTETHSSKRLKQGIVMVITQISVEKFIQMEDATSRVISRIIAQGCKNGQKCGSSEDTSALSRLKRDVSSHVIKSSPHIEVTKHSQKHQVLARMFGKDKTIKIVARPSSNSITRLLAPTRGPSVNIAVNRYSSKENTSLSAKVIFFSVSINNRKSSSLEAAMYCLVTFGVNTTQIVESKKLMNILNSRMATLKKQLNFTIKSLKLWNDINKRGVGGHSATLLTSPTHLPRPTPSADIPGTQDKISGDGEETMSRRTFVIAVSAGGGGFLVLLLLFVFLLTRCSRKWKGEFVPDRAYPDSQQNDSTSMISSFVDPSVPRITDVPHKPKMPANNNMKNGSKSGSKKGKKPSGVKVTYKPPKWD